MTRIAADWVHEPTTPARQSDGRPIVADELSALYRLPMRFARSKKLVLDPFRRNLVAGATHTCIERRVLHQAAASSPMARRRPGSVRHSGCRVRPLATGFARLRLNSPPTEPAAPVHARNG